MKKYLFILFFIPTLLLGQSPIKFPKGFTDSLAKYTKNGLPIVINANLKVDSLLSVDTVQNATSANKIVYVKDTLKAQYTQFSPVITVASSTSGKKNHADYICDGTADNVQIQMAINTLPGGGGMVQLLEGQYNISDTITLKSGVHLHGVGSSYQPANSIRTTIFLSNSSNCDMIATLDTVTGTNKYYDIEIEGITFDGNGSNNSGNLSIAKFYHTTILRIKDCSFYNSDSIGLNLLDPLDDTNWIIDCNFTSCKIGINDLGTENFYTNIHVNTCTQYGMLFSAGAKYVTNPLIWSCGNGIWSNSTGTQIIGGKIETCAESGIEFSQTTNSKIIGVTLRNNDSTSTAWEGGIRLYDCDNIIIADNICYDDQTPKRQESGLVLSNESTYITVENNDFVRNTYQIRGGGETETTNHIYNRNGIYNFPPIGTTTKDSTLTVVGSGSFSTNVKVGGGLGVGAITSSGDYSQMRSTDASLKVGRTGSSYLEMFYNYASFLPTLRVPSGAYMQIEADRFDFYTGATMGSRTARMAIDINGNLLVNTSQLYVQQSTGYVGIGTQTPASGIDIKKVVSGGIGGQLTLTNGAFAGNDAGAIDFAEAPGDIRGRIKFSIDGSPWGAAISFWNWNGSSILTKQFEINEAGTGVFTNGITLGTDLAVSEGGTGASTFTQNRLLLGNAANAVSASAIYDSSTVNRIGAVNRAFILSGSTGDLQQITGLGTRLMYMPDKAAFRVGILTYNADWWDDVNIGLYSFAFGQDAKASGNYSFAGSSTSQATADWAFAWGDQSTASERNAIVLADRGTATGFNSTVLGGVDDTCTGTYALATGYRTKSEAYANFTIGRYNVGGGNVSSWQATDPLFEAGGGTSVTNRINLLTLLKNGNLGLYTATPLHKLTIVGSYATNLNAFNFVNSDINKTRTTIAQATDTSSTYLVSSATGSPTFKITGKTGNNILTVDSATIAINDTVIITSPTDLPGTSILTLRANNTTTGLAFGYDIIRPFGSTADLNLNLQAKGTGQILITGYALNVASGYSYLYGLRISGNDATNTIYQAADIGITNNGGANGLHILNAGGNYFDGSLGVGLSPSATARLSIKNGLFANTTEWTNSRAQSIATLDSIGQLSITGLTVTKATPGVIGLNSIAIANASANYTQPRFGAGGFATNATGTDLAIASNAYIGSDGSWHYTTNGKASAISLQLNGLIIYVANYGAKDAAVNLTAGFSVDSNKVTTTYGNLVVNGGTPIVKVVSASLVYDCGAIAAGVDSVFTITATGAVAGNPVSVGVSSAPEAGLIVTAYCVSNDAVVVRISNHFLVAAVDPASRTYKVMCANF